MWLACLKTGQYRSESSIDLSVEFKNFDEWEFPGLILKYAFESVSAFMLESDEDTLMPNEEQLFRSDFGDSFYKLYSFSWMQCRA